ncbi:MAG: hypothetical protein DRJ05_17550 [Bacteroidetes bacterium]|nr:MAG: hypothetical protein DRJ05_17550 [Bacteroidota bacterium]
MTTIDAGNYWMVHNFDQFTFNAVLAVNSNYNMVVGDNGMILSTYDNGQQWVQEYTAVENNLNAVCRTASGFLWVAGDEGTLFSTHGSRMNIQDFGAQGMETGSTQEVSILNPVSNNNIENNEGLILTHKNYPNPSSGKTTISFELEQQAHVKLDIYNISGKLISNLKDQHSDAGYHEVIFDTNEWTPGIYTYLLRVGNSVENGKIIIN